MNRRLTHAEIVNRRARFGILIVAVVLFMAIVVAAGSSTGESDGDGIVAAPVTTVLDANRQVATGNTGTTEPPANAPKPPSPIDLLLIGITATTLPLDPIGQILPPTTTVPGEVEPTTTTEAPTTTTIPPSATPTTTTTTTTAPPATTVPPTTTTLPPPTTTLPPPTTTTLPPPPPPTTTTLPPPTTTTEPPVSWSASVTASVLGCVSETARVQWEVANSAAAWDAGWTLIIDGDNRGEFSAGTAVTTGTASATEDVPEGSNPSLTVNVHWEKSGEAASFGSFSASIDADCDD